MVYRYCPDEVPSKILSSWFEKRLSYDQYMEIWFGLVWFGLVLNGMVCGYCIDVVRDSFSMSDLTDSDMKNVINVLEADIPDSINVSNQSFIF